MTDPALPDQAAPDAGQPYRVLARKYRPSTFAQLIGQEAMVRTLTNAIRADRLAHAFMLTGVRGIGKTTTARIIARALNCVGADGKGGPTPEPCGVCEHCKAIAEDRHVDVMEMDAASRTGVGDIRELIDGVRYRPTSARFKVYIIDEVHMLSTQAFNALLKTLEEPPEHVKFVFATTEIRKVPVTVLSRCQRFDLRRVPAETLIAHYAAVAEKEGAKISEAALHLIARAADGSVRDGLSLLDQAISDAAHGGNELIDDARVRDMLGLADRSQTFMLLESVLKGDVGPALKILEQLYRDGADPLAVVEDLLEITHWLTRIKVAPEALDDPGVPEIERMRGKDLAGRLGMAALARAWQMLLKGLQEVRLAPSPIQAAEMVLVRLAHAAALPTPEEAIRALEGGAAPQKPAVSPRASQPSRAQPTAAAMAPAAGPAQPGPARAQMTGTGDAAPETRTERAARPETATKPDPLTFEAVAALARDLGDGRLHRFLTEDLRLVRFEPGRIEFNTGPKAAAGMVQALREFLNAATARPWTITVSSQSGRPPLDETQGDGLKAKARNHPLVKAVMETFPGARIDEVRPLPAEDPDADGADGAEDDTADKISD
ncbi:MAG TPA: DNA polymerase III subunit gamma/tau [Rhodospirillales bacterium]